ncbi:Tat (twin-arginine translocation) pathway signal sequence [Tangfeifania diversioriginum]|uniref:Tat (Twin-arginine translocation) pathway signal sequence n=1 Tax=Tangfeifania diversioriginum TaxID=1168035 RepID=A0A1M6C5G3_9BACT|nr:Dabb family protein [Tangfeifania diversioriginum]SHI56249.1 Tat (twin-arginine translocation) pathway signal sequence [Tangfeifania diversioriginum]
MKNRRTFLKKLAAGTVAAGFLSFTKKASAGEVQLKGALIHHVFFWLKEPGNKAHRKQFEKALEDLIKVDTIKVSHIGVPAETEERGVVENSYTYSYMVMFDSLKDQNIYQKHPLHLKFIEENEHLWGKVVVYDSVDA